MFSKGSSRWRIAIPFITLNLIVLLGLALFISNYIENKNTENLKAQLFTDARLIKEAALPQLAAAKPQSNLDPLSEYYYQLLGKKVTFVNADGIVLGDSGDDDLKSENFLNHPEIQQAAEAKDGLGNYIYSNAATGDDILYVAIKAETDEAIVGYVHLSIPLEDVQSNQQNIRNFILTATVFTILVTGLLALVIANRSMRPVRELTKTVNHMAEGDLSVRLMPTSHDEMSQLTTAFNNMAKQLQDKIDALTTEQERVNVILEHMADGIMIVEKDGLVRMINPAASRLLGTTTEKAVGHTFAEVVRQHQLIELWQQAQKNIEHRNEHVRMIETSRKEGRILQVIITPMTTTPSSKLVILQDLTRIRRLETIRRDFISNISHDLRTPLASLSLLVETLQNGALNDPPAAARFLNHMGQEVEVMTQLVSELLELSRIESGQVPLKIKPVHVRDNLLAPPVARMSSHADRNGLEILIDLPHDLPQVLADAERIQQVVTNLIHNAIKFSPQMARSASLPM